jgi:hypothetical protein
MPPDLVRGERMARQSLVGEPFPDLASCVGTLGAVQFQEFEDSLWSLARRTKGRPSRGAIAGEIAGGSPVRHHVLRPTWHVVRAEDLSWMLDLTAPRIIAQSRPQLRQAGLLEDRDRLVGRIVDIVESAEVPPTRREIGQAPTAQGVEPKAQGLSHLTMSAELDQRVTTGPHRNNLDTFAPYASRVPARDIDLDVWGGNLALLDGVVAATGRRVRPKRKADPVLLEITASRPLSPTDRERIETDAASLIDHRDTTVDLQWKDPA